MRALSLMGTGVLLLGLLFEVQLSAEGLVALVVLAALGALARGRAGLASAASAVALTAYLMAASAPPHPARLGLAAAAVLLLALASQRRLMVIATSSAVLIPLGLVTFILSRSVWSAEASRMAAITIGAALAACGALLVVLAPAARRLNAGVVIVAVAMVWLLGPPTGQTTLPAWWFDAKALPRTAAAHQLERLVAAGNADAGFALAASALRENADPQQLRHICPPRGRERSLGEGFHSQIEIGKRACNAAKRGARLGELGAESLVELPTDDWRAPLLRLRADLWMQAGAIEQAVTTYREAAAAGDRFALRNATRALLDRGREAEAAELADPTDPLSQVWLGGEAEAHTWQAWNDALDFHGIQTARRVGIHPLFGHGWLRSFYNPELGRRFLSAMTKRKPTRFTVAVPLTPGRIMPAEVQLLFRSQAGFRVIFENEMGERLIYACNPVEPAPRQRSHALPHPGCSGNGWSEATIRPRDVISGPLTAIILRGRFDLAYLRATKVEP